MPNRSSPSGTRYSGLFRDMVNDTMELYNNGVLVPLNAADLSAVAEDALPATDDTYDLGSATFRWAEGHFSDFVAVGSDHAQSGALRIPHGSGLHTRDFEGTDDIPLISTDQFSIIIGGADGGQVIPGVDGNWFLGSSTQRWDLMFLYDFLEIAVTGEPAGNFGAIRLRNGNPGRVSWRNLGDTADLSLTVNASNQFVFNGGPVVPNADGTRDLGSGSLRWANIFVNLPAADPAVAGQLYHTSGTVMVSL